MPSSWRVVSMELRTRGRTDLVGPLRNAIRREGEPAVRAAQAAWLSVEVTSTRGGTARPDRSTQLRQRVANATFVQITPTGIRIAVRAGRVDPRYGRSLPWYLNASGRPWRHRVFGRNTGRPSDWTQQRGQPVFFTAIGAYAPRFRAAAEAAMERVARDF
jgi:hypothetical protein